MCDVDQEQVYPEWRGFASIDPLSRLTLYIPGGCMMEASLGLRPTTDDTRDSRRKVDVPPPPFLSSPNALLGLRGVVSDDCARCESSSWLWVERVIYGGGFELRYVGKRSK